MGKRAIVYTVDGDSNCIAQMEDSVRSVRRFLGDIDIVICTNCPDAPFDLPYGQKVVDVSKLVGEYGLAETGVFWRGRQCSPMLLFRLALPLVQELSEYGKVLYLDSDTEVWSPEASRMFDLDNEGHEVTAVRDSLSRRRVWNRIKQVEHAAPRPEGTPYFQRWDYLLDTKAYVNSGVVVFDLDRLRPGYAERFGFVVDQLRKRKPPYPDQDMLNVFYDIFPVMDRSYNNWDGCPENCRIRHNVGGFRRHTKFYPSENVKRPTAALGVKDPLAHVVVLTERTGAGAVRKWLPDSSEVAEVPYDSGDVLSGAILKTDCPREDNIDVEYAALWHAHYRALRLAWTRGWESVAVIEDTWVPRDVPFSLLPPDFSLAVADSGGTSWKLLHEDGENLRAASSKFYVVSRRCMRPLMWLFESLLDPGTPYRKMRMVHHWFNDSIRGKQRMYFLSR